MNNLKIKKIEDLFNLIENQLNLGEQKDWTESHLITALNELKELVIDSIKQPDLMEIYYDSDFPRQLKNLNTRRN